MRRHPLFRLLAFLPALWLPLIVGEPGLLDPCPMHGGMAHHSMQHAAEDAHSAHHGHRAPMGDHKGHQCTCIGCCSVSAVLQTSTTTELALPIAVQRVARAVPNVESRARPAPDFSRPHTTGPPRA